eukprot:3419394-Pyramimonas_sp.AAC.1
MEQQEVFAASGETRRHTRLSGPSKRPNSEEPMWAESWRRSSSFSPTALPLACRRLPRRAEPPAVGVG